MSSILSASPFLTPSLLRQTSVLREELNIAVNEQISGKISDLTAHLKGDYAALSGMDSQISRLQGHRIMTAEVGLMAEMMQSALDVINSETDSLLSRLTVASASQTSQQLGALTSDAAAIFDNIISVLNSRTSDRALFSGDASALSPLPPSDEILTAIRPALAGVTTAEDLMQAVQDWFDTPSGFESLYLGGEARSAVAIGEEQSVALGITALDSGLRGTLAGIASLALINAGYVQISNDEKFASLNVATQKLTSSSDERFHMTSKLGVVQERIEKTQSRNESNLAALQLARASLVEVDPYETAIRLKDLETKLDTFYTILSRLSNLSLVNYLR